jgi:iron(III) transport system substrate-binding protein
MAVISETNCGNRRAESKDLLTTGGDTMKRNRKGWIQGGVAIILIIGVMGVIVFPAGAASKFPPAIEKLIPQAKTEGEVSLFTGSVKVTAKEQERFSQAFSKHYGIPVKVILSGLGSHPEVIQRLREEAKVGVKPAVDVFNTAIKFLQGLKQANLIEAIDWKDFGVHEKDIFPTLSAVDIQTNVRAVVYNTNLVKKTDAPRKYEDLLDKRWKGKIVAPGNAQIFPFIALIMGEEAGINLVKRLVEDQKLAFTTTVTDVAVRVANGEFLIGYGYSAEIDKMRGAPIENAPMKFGAFRQCSVVLKNVAHPAAGRLLVHFMATVPEGKKLIHEILNWGKYDTPGTEAYELAQGSGLLFAKDVGDEIEWETKENPRLSERFQKVLGL